MLESLSSSFLAPLLIVASLVASAHILLSKEDVRAAIGWIAVVWIAPGLGVLLYLLLGINRVRRRAQERRRRRLGDLPGEGEGDSAALDVLDPTADPAMVAHARLAWRLTRMPLTAGNALSPLIDGDEAYPAMLDAIAAARHSVALSTYIFQWDETGRSFAEALARAAARGVRTAVLVDAMGSPFVARRLRRLGIEARAFNMPSPGHLALLNLRTHRKLLVADGCQAFTGGMNIRDVHRRGGRHAFSARDVMFAVEGPVVAQLMSVFAEDWRFAGGAPLEGPDWFPEDLVRPGGAVCRTVSDGPDMRFSAVAWILESILAAARNRVVVATPYFLPDLGLIAALSQAALRGVEVHVLIPERSNYRVFGWAAQAQLLPLVEHGCQVHLTPPPFDHSKLMVVDGYWALIGSSNWDTRSFRLNFELNCEVYDGKFASRIEAILDERMAAARPLSREDLVRRPLARRLRDRAAWLMSPYL
ncbi:MAG: cardiolipin synthase [Alphaproteobacteria bacterium]|nr:MAG: cardiolipin synthase [Alphaproteobacteria bacterium]